MVTYLELSREEAVTLRNTFAIRLRELRQELVRTDARAFRRDLRTELEHLEGIDARLKDSFVRPAVRDQSA